MPDAGPKARHTVTHAYPPTQDLGDGLVLRWTTARDLDRVGSLAASVFRRVHDPPNARQVAWTRDLGGGRHPLTSEDRGVFVEDTRSGQVVASMWLIPQVWRFDGIPFGVGRPEQVVSHPDYRNRGLVRALFDAFHRRSAVDGELAQAITGISYFYRQFGYEYALDLRGGQRVAFADIPTLTAGATDPYRLRDATVDDLPFIMSLYERDRRRSLVSTDVPRAYWCWMLDGVNHDIGKGWHALVVVDADNRSRGYVLPRSRRWEGELDIRTIALDDGVAYVSVIRPLLRALRDWASQVPQVTGMEAAAVDQLWFSLGATHPLYEALAQGLTSRWEPPDAWYVRVADLPGFVRHVAPALERRLPGTAAEGFSGELALEFYRGGLRIVFEHGRLATAEPWQRAVQSEVPGAGFPPLVFLQLLFGRRSLDELRHAFADVYVSDEVSPVLRALFPPRYSLALPLD